MISPKPNSSELTTKRRDAPKKKAQSLNKDAVPCIGSGEDGNAEYLA